MKLLLTIFFIGIALPQDFTTLTLLKEIQVESDFMRVDNFGKIYLVKGDEVFMYSKNGDFLSQNSNKLLGEINDLDVTSGLEMSAFFKDQLQVVFLDNQLALRGNQISLDLLDFEQISEVCTSHGNGIWFPASNFCCFSFRKIPQNRLIGAAKAAWRAIVVVCESIASSVRSWGLMHRSHR
jgi:hypothetical protein